MKVAPLFHALKRAAWCQPLLVHTGQHYDPEMSESFLNDLNLPPPDIRLGVGSGTHAEQTAGVVVSYERVCLDEPPDWIVVVGDVNSTLSCTLVGARMQVPVVHLEAGLRSGDRSMPEEINRIVTDALASLLWTHSADADENLAREGVPIERIERVGNVMIDSFEFLRPQITAADVAGRIGLGGDFGVVTLHRPSNVDDDARLGAIVTALVKVADVIPLVFPVHPRTGKRLSVGAHGEVLARHPAVHLVSPLSYIEFMSLVLRSRLVVTDSGGIQEETTYLGTPCMTLRNTTERPVTVREGTNRLVEPGELLDGARLVLDGDWPAGRVPDGWDGRAAERAAASLRAAVGDGQRAGREGFE